MLHFMKLDGQPPELNCTGKINVCTAEHNQIIAFCDEETNPLNPDCWKIIIDISKRDKDLLAEIIADAFTLLSLGGKFSRFIPENK